MPIWLKKYLSALLALALLAGCGPAGKDDEKKGERIVCISKQYSEIMYALGAQDQLAGVDLTSTYPPEINRLPKVGYHRALAVEGILAVKPTLILHDNNIGPEHVVKQLEELNIPMKVFAARGSTIDSTKMLIREMGGYFHKEKKAESLCQNLDKEMTEAYATAKQYKDSPRVLIIHFGQAMNTYLVMTRKNIAAKIVGWAGGRMSVDAEKGMRPMSAEVVAASDPDIILLTDFGYDRLGSRQGILELPGIAATKAAKTGRIYRVEEHDMVYLGPRTGQVVLRLQKLIHQHGERPEKE